ncbi:MAG: DUF1592 domain-containing protein [Verrucomicrobia bacterium]|nr:DUF1592 domain-containing protein [Verrucomicrobiota bacterium]
MRRRGGGFRWLALGLTLASAPAGASPDVTAFLGRHCLRCHGAEKQKADHDFRAFRLPLAGAAALVEAKDIIDQLTLGEMPPREEPQPSDAERLAVIRALRAGIASARDAGAAAGARTVLRRLSNREYERTLATLFGRRVDTLGLTADFPKEKASERLDTIGRSLVTSGLLLDQYFHAAHRIVEQRLGRPLPVPRTWHFAGNFVQYEELQGPHKAAFNFRYLCLYEQPNTDTRQGGYGHIEDFLQGVPSSGLYDIAVLAQALHRDTHYDPTIFGIDLTEPFLLGVVPGDASRNHIHYPQAIEPLLGQAVVPDDEPRWLRFRVWLEQGQTPRFIFPNGPYESRASVLTINRRYADDFQGRFAKAGVSRTHLLREGKLPHIRISEITIEGPLPEAGGGAEEVAVFGPEGFQADRAAAQLEAFAARAYRRPLTPEDRAALAAVRSGRLREGASPRSAALDTVKFILCSPSFLYLDEETGAAGTRLGPHALATRLAYALTATLPDAELRAAADSGRLAEDAELARQAGRLLASPATDAFAAGFLDGWLHLRDLGGMPPPRETARVYYAENLPEAMKTEARLFFLHLLRGNGPLHDFLEADYTFADKRLARLYQLPDRASLRLADGFQRVSLAGSAQRGGLLGMAGVLTVSANGVETSPVTRGVWVSENILGIRPPPPPDVVPAVEPDVNGTTTLRERLARHRADVACAECHRKIDPLGFALESFDPIGRWRVAYPKPKGNAPAPAVDASGELSSGETYAGFPEFRRLLAANRRDVFTRHLIRQFLSYGTGRHLEAADEPVVEQVLEAVRKDGFGLRTLVITAVASELFCSR